MSKDEDEAARILKDLEKHGFPLEVRTTKMLEAKGWEITNQATFQDIETKRFRTVDIIAQKNLLLKPDDMSIELFLVIECKRSPEKPKPWVFYASHYDLNDNEMKRKTVASSHFTASSIAYQRKYSDKIINMIRRFVVTHFKAPIFSKLGYIPIEAFTEGQTKSIHKATMQVCNATLDYEYRIDESGFEFPFGTLFIPVIVTDEHLYTYDGKQLNREDGLFYHVTYADSSFMLEIIAEDFVPLYLDSLDNQIMEFQRSKQ